MAEFRLKIFTPAGLVLEDSAREVKLPTEAGEIGILPQHARYCGILGNGQMEYLPAQSSTPKKLQVRGGFCSFVDETLTLLADECRIES
jgi:F0F1-type ATP synthase epsilon subunit